MSEPESEPPGETGDGRDGGEEGAAPITVTQPLLLRCLDSDHEPGCTLCLEAPPREEEDNWMLLGQAGAKNGEKRLRRLLTRTPEWASPKDRRALADVLDSEPTMEPVTRVLRGTANVGELRKTHMIGLARAWNYKSDIWVHKTMRRPVSSPETLPELPVRRAKRTVYGIYADVADGNLPSGSTPAVGGGSALLSYGRQRVTGQFGASEGGGPTASLGGAGYQHQHYTNVANQQQQQQQQNGIVYLPRGAGMDETRAFIATQFVPMAPIYRGLVAGSSLRPMLTDSGVSFLDKRVIEELHRSASNYETVRRAFVATGGAARAALAALSTGSRPPGMNRYTTPSEMNGGFSNGTGGGQSSDRMMSAPAWRLLAGRQSPLESVLWQLMTQTGAAAAAHRARLAAAAGTSTGPMALAPGAAAWLADMRRVYLTSLHMLSEAAWLVKHLAMGRTDVYLTACAELSDALAAVSAAASAGMMDRVGWVSALMQNTASDAPALAEGLLPLTPPFYEAMRIHLVIIPHPDLSLEA